MLLGAQMFQCQLGLTGGKCCKETTDKRRRIVLKEPETGNTDTAHLMSRGQYEEPMDRPLEQHVMDVSQT